MPSREILISHSFDGGFASDLGALVNPAIEARGAGGHIRIPHLLRADNVYFRLDGATVKAGGTSKYNSTTIASGQEIRGMFEYIRAGTAGSATRKRVAHAGTVIVSDDNDGTFSNLFTGLQDDKVPHYNVFEDVLIIASDSTVDVPKSWDQSTAQNLAGSPPNFAFSATHSNRLWASGNAASPSTLYYSSVQDHEEWTGGNSGSIDVDPNDGDVITGIIPYRGELIVFKGPNLGSIHRVIGDPADSDFARRRVIQGVGAIWQNSIFPYGNDIGFLATDGSIRSFLTTDKFGDYEQNALSDPISTWIRDHLTISAARTAWASVDNIRGYVMFTLPIDTATAPNHVMLMDFRFRPMRFSHWTSFDGFSVARMSDPDNSNMPILYLGGSDGFIRKTQQPAFAIDDNTSINFGLKTPALSYNTVNRSKHLSKIGVGVRAAGTVSVTVNVTNENAHTDTTTISGIQGGTALGVFELDTDTLGGEIHKTYWADMTDTSSFREASFEIENEGLNQGLEITEFYAVFDSSDNPNYEN